MWGACPSDNVRQEYRVRLRINGFAKERQIPPEETGVLVLAGDFFFGGANEIERFVDYIAEEVYELENIPVVVLVTRKMFVGVDTKIAKRTTLFSFAICHTRTLKSTP